MKNTKFNEKFKIIAILILILTPFCLLLKVKADSGWDSDYDSGSSWSSSDYDSGSSWGTSSWDDDRGTTYSKSYSSDLDMVDLIFILIFITIIIIALSKKSKKIQNTIKESINYADISEDKLKELIPDMTLNEVKRVVYDRFIEIQNAWMDFDYDKLRTLCTDELYNSYIAQLDVLKIKNNKNIMSDFINQGIKITEIKEENDNISITAIMKVSFYDYVVDSNEKVVRGSKKNKITNNYRMTFIKAKDSSTQTDHCPNCGAPISDNASQKCEYCNSTIVKSSSEFVLSKKTNINK